MKVSFFIEDVNDVVVSIDNIDYGIPVPVFVQQHPDFSLYTDGETDLCTEVEAPIAGVFMRISDSSIYVLNSVDWVGMRPPRRPPTRP